MLKDIKIGDGATLHVGSDCYPYTVISITPTGKTIIIQADGYKSVGGQWPDNIFEYKPNPTGSILKCRWNEKTQRWKANCFPVGIGHRRYYQDPHF